MSVSGSSKEIFHKRKFWGKLARNAAFGATRATPRVADPACTGIARDRSDIANDSACVSGPRCTFRRIRVLDKLNGLSRRGGVGTPK